MFLHSVYEQPEITALGIIQTHTLPRNIYASEVHRDISTNNSACLIPHTWF